MAQDIFLEITGIAGESRDAKHKDAIDVESFSWGESVAISGGAVTGRVASQDVNIVARFSKASLSLMQACATAKHISDAKLSVRRAGKSLVEYLHWTFSDVLIASYQTGGTQQGDAPTDAFSMNFGKMTVEYFPQNPDGSLGAPTTIGLDFNTKA